MYVQSPLIWWQIYQDVKHSEVCGKFERVLVYLTHRSLDCTTKSPMNQTILLQGTYQMTDI